jgi:hypothetical protein
MLLKLLASIQLVVDKGQHEYEASSVALDLPVGLKFKFLDCISEEIMKYKLYPCDKEFESIAKAIVSTYPCLRSKAGIEGWEVWKASLKFKMGNVHGNMRQVGCMEALVNAGRRSKYKPLLPGPKKGLKKLDVVRPITYQIYHLAAVMKVLKTCVNNYKSS